MSRAALDYFGSLIATRVRDEAIRDWDMILDGGMKDSDSQAIRARIDRLQMSGAALELLSDLIPRIVDTTLHHLLWTLEQEESLDVAVRIESGVVSNLREVSDGLAGELCEWIPRFSKERHS